MALKYRLYRCEVIGSGSSAMDPKRAELSNYIVEDGSGAFFEDLQHHSRAMRYCFARCEESVHLQMASDETIVPLSPLFETELELQNWLDGNSILDDTEKQQMEADGFSMSWTADGTPRREQWRYIMRQCVQTGDMVRTAHEGGLPLYTNALDSEWRDIPPGSRDEAVHWMQSKGITPPVILPSAKLRDIIQDVHVGAEWPAVGFSYIEI